MNVYEELMDLRLNFDHRNLIKELGGTTRTARTLNNFLGEERFTRQTVNYWKQANKIPDRVFFDCPEVWLDLISKVS